MPTGHSYIFFLSGIHKDCDFSGHGTHFRSHRMQACSYSMRRLWIPAFLFCVPDAHSVSGYPVFSTDAVSVFSFRISFPAFPTTVTLAKGWELQKLYIYSGNNPANGSMKPAVEYLQKGWMRSESVANGGKIPVAGGKGFRIMFTAVNSKTGIREYMTIMLK